MADAVPAVPSTEGGGVAPPWKFSPQQTTMPVPAWIAQLCALPSAIADAVRLGEAPAPQPTIGPEAAAGLPASRPMLTVSVNATHNGRATEDSNSGATSKDRGTIGEAIRTVPLHR